MLTAIVDTFAGLLYGTGETPIASRLGRRPVVAPSGLLAVGLGVLALMCA